MTGIITTADLREGDHIHYGLNLQLTNRREYPTRDGHTGPVIAFTGIVTNYHDLVFRAIAGDAFARFAVGSLGRIGRPHPLWTVEGAADLDTWHRINPT